MSETITAQTALVVQPKGDEEFAFTRVKKNKNYFPSSGSILSHQKNSREVRTMDVFDVMQGASKGASNLFFKLIKERNVETNIVNMVPKDSAEAAAVTRAYKELHALQIVVRVKRGVYLINPYAAFPSSADNFESIKKRWINLNP